MRAVAGTLSSVVAANCRAERARRGWTQAQLGERLGWQRASVGHLEQNRRYVTVDDLVVLCRVFDVPVARLLTGADPPALAALGLAPPGG